MVTEEKKANDDDDENDNDGDDGDAKEVNDGDDGDDGDGDDEAPTPAAAVGEEKDDASRDAMDENADGTGTQK